MVFLWIGGVSICFFAEREREKETDKQTERQTEKKLTYRQTETTTF